MVSLLHGHLPKEGDFGVFEVRGIPLEIHIVLFGVCDVALEEGVVV